MAVKSIECIVKKPKSVLNSSSSVAETPATDWVIMGFLSGFHLVAVLSLLFYSPFWKTFILTFIEFSMGALGITAGYHR